MMSEYGWRLALGSGAGPGRLSQSYPALACPEELL